MNKAYRFSDIQQIAKQFWNESLLGIQFPIEVGLLEQAILLNYPISLVKLNKLSLDTVTEYLKSRSIDINGVDDNKELYGFIICQSSHTYIFLNGTEPVQEQLFTIAHEFAHYLLDYKLPRQSLVNIFGVSICDALDNKRSFSTEERIAAIIKGYSLKSFFHLLDTPVTSAIHRQAIWHAEEAADQLAFELLAPFDEILKDIKSQGIQKSYTPLIAYLKPTLNTNYGLPYNIAEFYSNQLASQISGGISLREKWKI